MALKHKGEEPVPDAKKRKRVGFTKIGNLFLVKSINFRFPSSSVDFTATLVVSSWIFFFLNLALKLMNWTFARAFSTQLLFPPLLWRWKCHVLRVLFNFLQIRWEIAKF